MENVEPVFFGEFLLYVKGMGMFFGVGGDGMIEVLWRMRGSGLFYQSYPASPG